MDFIIKCYQTGFDVEWCNFILGFPSLVHFDSEFVFCVSLKKFCWFSHGDVGCPYLRSHCDQFQFGLHLISINWNSRGWRLMLTSVKWLSSDVIWPFNANNGINKHFNWKTLALIEFSYTVALQRWKKWSNWAKICLKILKRVTTKTIFFLSFEIKIFENSNSNLSIKYWKIIKNIKNI